MHNDCFQLGVWSTINTHFSFDAHSHQRTIYLVLALMHWCCNFYNYAAGVYEIICMIKTSFCGVHNNWWNFWKSGTQLLCTLFLKKYGKHNSVVLRIQNFYDLSPFSVCFFSYSKFHNLESKLIWDPKLLMLDWKHFCHIVDTQMSSFVII